MTSKQSLIAAALVTATVAVAPSQAAVQLTEFNSNTGDGLTFEFCEFTNTGTTAVDMTGWSQSDNGREVGEVGHILTAFGTLQPGESAIFTEATPDAFRTYWWGSTSAAPTGLKIIGPYTNDNLSSGGDEVNLYDGNGTLVDRLTYNGGPGAPSGGGNANGVTRNAPAGYAVNANRNIDWLNSSLGDVYGSFRAFNNASLLGNPGQFTPTAVPEPTSLGLIALAGLAAAHRRRAR
jgi:hypothetical protein